MKVLEAELLAVFDRGVDALIPADEFNRLAMQVFAHQVTHNPPYAALCRARGVAGETPAHWGEIPAVHTEAFKHAEFTTVPVGAPRVEYLTSGTTGSDARRGRHILPDTSLYHAALAPNFQAHVLPDVAHIRILVCGPSAEHFPTSSLGHMHSWCVARFGTAGSGLFWDAAGPRFDELAAAMQAAERESEPVCLLGTAFGMVHLLDWLRARDQGFRLPAGSRIMDTGGYKGRSREVAKADLYAEYGRRLGIPLSHVVNEYGMTELGSQFYDRTLRLGVVEDPAHRLKAVPPWVRVQVMDPETLAPAPDGTAGLLRFFDLANLHSVSAIQTDDLGIRRGECFELLGRVAGAAPRGCSLPVEALLETRS